MHLELDPDTYNVPFVALILGGIAACSATVSALIVGPICHARGKREILRTLKVPRTPRL